MKSRVFRTEGRRRPKSGQRFAWITTSTSMINYYCYAVGEDFGPFFLKFGSNFPYMPSARSNNLPDKNLTHSQQISRIKHSWPIGTSPPFARDPKNGHSAPSLTSVMNALLPRRDGGSA
jgi:hypothetical protein